MDNHYHQSSIRNPQSAIRNQEAWVFLLCLLIGFAALWTVAPSLQGEAVIRTGIGNDLLLGGSRGRQGLIGSLYYAPLPTLLALPLLPLPPPFGEEWSLVIVAIVSAAFMGAGVSAWLRQCGISTFTRLGVAVAVFASPPFLRGMLQGTGEPLFAFLIFAAFCLLMHWWRTDALRSLAYLAIVVALALATRFQAVALFAVMLTFVIIHLIQRVATGNTKTPVRRRRTEDGGRKSEIRSYAEATLIVFLTPSLYVAGLWITVNWLIMGEPFFFVRGLANTTGSEDHWFALLKDGCAWRPALLLCLLALLARLAAALTHRRLKRMAGFALLIACLAFWHDRDVPLAREPADADAELTRVLAEFNDTFGRDWLVVSGYRGYEMDRDQTAHLYHSLNFYADQMLKDTRGKRAYLLVPAPEGADRWEDINLKYPHIFNEPAPFTVYEKSYRHWQLWRIVRMDETDRK